MCYFGPMTGGSERRTAAIVAADVVGYSRMMGRDETATLEALRHHRSELIDPLIASFNGRIAKTMGDGLLLEFADVVEAVGCALDFQESMARRNANIPEDEQIVFRIGVNLGDIIFEDGDIFGHGVNLAARLEGLAEPGGILISHTVYDGVAGKLEVEFADCGKRAFKNIAESVHVWSWPRQLPDIRQDRKPFVVVSEFESRSEEEQTLAEDLRDDLMTALSRLTGMEVTPDQRKADYLIHGSVRLAGRRCRISAQLIAVAGDEQLWAERYDEKTDDPYDVLNHSVIQISMSVRRRVATDDAENADGKNFDEMTLEQLLSVSGVSFFTPTKEGWLRAGMIAELALERAPTNFMALAMAAAGYGMAEMFYGFREPNLEVVDLAFERLEEARRQTNKSDMLQITYSAMLTFARGRHHEAAVAAERALQLNPDYNMALWTLGAAQVFAGKYADGIETATRAVNVDIRDPYVHLYSRIVGYGYFAAEEHGDAADWFWKADQLAPGLPHNLTGLAVCQWNNADYEGVHGTISRLLDEEPKFRVGDMMALPFSDTAVWQRFLSGLRNSGAPD